MRSPWTVLAATIAIQAMISAAALAGPVLAPDVAARIGTRATLVGVQVGLVYGAAALASLAAGRVIARHGALRTSQGALALAAAGLAVCLTGSLPAIAAGSLLIGLGYGVVTPASSHLLAQSTPAHRMGFVFSLKQTGVPLGGILAGLTLPPLALAFGWRAALGLAAVSCLLVALTAQPLRAVLDRDRRRGGGTGAPPALKTLLADPGLRGLALTSFVFAAMQLILTGFLVTYLAQARGLPLAQAGATLAVAQAAGVAGRLLWGWCADRFATARQVLALLAALSAVCAAVFAQGTDAGALLLLGAVSALFGAAAIGWNGVFLAEVARIAPPGRVAAATGAALFMTYAGVVAGPPAFAALVEHFGYGPAFAAASAMMAAMALALLFGGGADRAARLTESPR
ncbi:MFS transporter [Roseivivax sp. CAU 1761]